MTGVASYMSSPVQFIHPDKNFHEALVKMYEHNIGALLVIEGDKYVGIFTKTDSFHRVFKKDSESAKIRVSDIMTTHIITIDKDQQLEKASNLMNENKIHHIAVTDNDEIVGILSSKDLERYYMESAKKKG